MKLTTIWTLPAMTVRERVRRTRELGWQTAAHRMPRRLAYWSFIDTGARTIGGSEVVPEVRYVDLVGRLEPS